MGNDHELNLTGDSMEEIIAKIYDWQDLDEHLDTLKAFKRDTPERVKLDTESGWFIKKEKMNVQAG